MPCRDPSRLRPDCLTPAMLYSNCSATRQTWPVTCLEIACRPGLGVVGHPISTDGGSLTSD